MDPTTSDQLVSDDSLMYKQRLAALTREVAVLAALPTRSMPAGAFATLASFGDAPKAPAKRRQRQKPYERARGPLATCAANNIADMRVRTTKADIADRRIARDVHSQAETVPLSAADLANACEALLLTPDLVSVALAHPPQGLEEETWQLQPGTCGPARQCRTRSAASDRSCCVRRPPPRSPKSSKGFCWWADQTALR